MKKNDPNKLNALSPLAMLSAMFATIFGRTPMRPRFSVKLDYKTPHGPDMLEQRRELRPAKREKRKQRMRLKRRRGWV